MLGDAKEDAGGKRQFASEAPVEADELREDLGQHDVHEAEHPGEEHHGVDGRGDHFLLDRLAELEVRDEAAQNRLEVAAALARDEVAGNICG